MLTEVEKNKSIAMQIFSAADFFVGHAAINGQKQQIIEVQILFSKEPPPRMYVNRAGKQK